MNFHWLRLFSMLGELLHFGRAAAALNLSQSALSVQIKNLEDALQVSFFIRDRRSVSLTRAGGIFLEEARRLLHGMETAERTLRRAQAGEVGVIRIGFVNAATLGVLPKIVGHYRQFFPEIELQLRNLPTERQGIALLRDEIDIGFFAFAIRGESAGSNSYTERAVCLLPSLASPTY